jgi:hypothetical protein
MRTMSLVAGLAISAILGGCGGTVGGTVFVRDNGARVHCKTKTVNVRHGPGMKPSVDSPEHKVCPGYSVNLAFGTPVPVGHAHARQKPPDPPTAPWLNVDNTATDQITFSVPGTEKPGKRYEYSLEIEGEGKLDPRIVVQ